MTFRNTACIKNIVFGCPNTKDTNSHFLGDCAGMLVTTGIANTFVGNTAGYGTTTGSYNTAVGHGALYSNKSGQFNIAIGIDSLYNGAAGNGNVAIGFLAGSLTITDRQCNTLVGEYANASGAALNTTVIGASAACSASGANNTVIGACAGVGLTTGANNTIIGSWCPLSMTSGNNQLLISWGWNGTSSPCGYIYGTTTGISVGNTAPAAALHVTGEIIASTDITAYYSDRRLKENIIIIDCALDKVKKITGVKYFPNHLAEKYGFESRNEHIGLLADEVETILPEAVTLAPFDIDENQCSISGENYKTIKYEKIVPLLIQSIKELDIRLSNLDKNLLQEII